MGESRSQGAGEGVGEGARVRKQVTKRSTHARPGMHMQQCSAVRQGGRGRGELAKSGDHTVVLSCSSYSSNPIGFRTNSATQIYLRRRGEGQCGQNAQSSGGLQTVMLSALQLVKAAGRQPNAVR